MSFGEPASQDRRKRFVIAIFMAAGIALSIALHVYFVLNWAYYERYIPPSHLAQTGGRQPLPLLFETPLSFRHGLIILLILGSAIPFFEKTEPWRTGAAFATGVGLGHMALLHSSSGVGNLWPLAFSSIFIITGGFAFAGAALVSFVMQRFR